MSFRFSRLVLLLVIIVGCHSTPLRPPPGGGDEASQQRWLKDYRQARAAQTAGNGADACKLFGSLAADAKFPAQKVAELRAWETCGKPSQIDRSQLPPYLSDLGLEIALKLAGSAGDKPAEMELAVEKSRQKLPQSEKVKWLNVALARAKELGNEDKQSEIRKRLYLIAPRLNPEPKEREYLATAVDFRLARQFGKAREFYERVVKGKNVTLDDKITALKGLRLAAKNERKNDGHLEAGARMMTFLKTALKANPKQVALRTASYEAQTYQARALWTQGRTSEARAIFDGIEKQLRGRVSLAELYWLKARMAEEERDHAAVSSLLERALKERIVDTSLRDKILWYSAWNERRQAHYEAAAARLQELDEKTQDEFMRVRALFWLGKARADLKQDAQARAAFEKLIGLDPLGYYGLLAHRHLDLPIAFKPRAPAVAPEGAGVLPLDVTLAEWLAQLDERDVMMALLEQSSRAYKKESEQNDEGWFTLFKYYAKAGLYTKLFDAIGGLAPERRRSLLESHPELLFPQPWAEDVHAASSRFGVQEELIYAIMRQESAFEPRARSGADAFGLLQILPEVAEKLSTAHQIPYTQMEDLFDPATNIRVGAAHLHDLFKSHHGQFILSVAAYNANENAIRNWMKTRFRGDALEFIEEIPYEETRVYVRLVMRNLIFYSLLRSGSGKIEFPEWVLKLEAAGS